MAKTTPWSVKGIDGETRDVARAAARATGMTIGHWIDHAILSSTEKPALPGLSILRLWRPKAGKLLPYIANVAPGKTLWGAAATLAVVVTAGLLTVQPFSSGPGRSGMEISVADAERVQAVAPAAGPSQAAATEPAAEPETEPSEASAPAPQIASTRPDPVFEPEKAGPDDNTAPLARKQPEPAPLLGRPGIAEVQRLLADLQFTPGPADGMTGARTVAAIRLYQQYGGLQVNGIADQGLLTDLRKIVGTMQAQAE